MAPGALLRVWLPALALALGACGGGEPGDADTPGLVHGIPFTDVEVNAFSGVRTQRTVAVSDAAAWATLWAEHTSNVSPAPARPAVDFSADTVAAVFLGEVTECTRPVVDSVLAAGTRVRVQWRAIAPGSGQACPAVVMAPVHMVRFANPQKLAVDFVRLQ